MNKYGLSWQIVLSGINLCDGKFKNLVVFSIAQHLQDGYVTMLWQVQPHVAARQLSRLAAYRPLPEEPHLYLSSAGQASGWPGDHGREAAKSQQIRKYAGMSQGAHDQIVIFLFHPLDFVEKNENICKNKQTHYFKSETPPMCTFINISRLTCYKTSPVSQVLSCFITV